MLFASSSISPVPLIRRPNIPPLYLVLMHGLLDPGHEVFLWFLTHFGLSLVLDSTYTQSLSDPTGLLVPYSTGSLYDLLSK